MELYITWSACLQVCLLCCTNVFSSEQGNHKSDAKQFQCYTKIVCSKVMEWTNSENVYWLTYFKFTPLHKGWLSASTLYIMLLTDAALEDRWLYTVAYPSQPNSHMHTLVHYIHTQGLLQDLPHYLSFQKWDTIHSCAIHWETTMPANEPFNLRMREWRDSEYLELSGIVKVPETMASGCSPNGVVKKQSLYRRHPKA